MFFKSIVFKAVKNGKVRALHSQKKNKRSKKLHNVRIRIHERTIRRFLKKTCKKVKNFKR